MPTDSFSAPSGFSSSRCCSICLASMSVTMPSNRQNAFTPGRSVIIISGPNENSQKASISVYVLAANSQDEVYEGTTRPRPESDKQTRKLDDEMNDIETEEKSITLRDWRQESNQSKMWCPSVQQRSGHSCPQTRSHVEIENKCPKRDKSAIQTARNTDAHYETKLLKGISTLSN